MEQYVNEIKKNLDPTSEQIVRMRQGILEKSNAKADKRLHRRKAWIIPLTVCLIFLFSLTVFAAVVQNNRSTTLYHWSDSALAKNLNISASNAGYTITAKTIFGDEAHTYILFTLARDDGGVLRINTKKERANICFGTVSAQSESKGVFYATQPIFILEDHDPNDNKITFGTTLWNTDDPSCSTNVIGSTIDMKFSGLYTGGLGDLWNLYAENSGVWNLTIPVDYHSFGKQYQTDIPFDYQGKAITLNTITISPLDISFLFTGNKDDLYQISTDAFEYQGHPLRLVLKSGEKIGFEMGAGGHGRLTANLNLLEHGPIEAENIAALQITDHATIPITLTKQ